MRLVDWLNLKQVKPGLLGVIIREILEEERKLSRKATKQEKKLRRTTEK